MPVKKSYDDVTRLKILCALQKKGSIKANLNKIRRDTGIEITKIQRIMRFFEEEMGLEQFYPVISSKAVGMNINGIALLQFSSNSEQIMHDFVEVCKKERNIVNINKVVASDKWSVYLRIIAKNLEEFDKIVNINILSDPVISKFIVDKKYSFFANPILKTISRSETLLHLLLEKESKKKDLTSVKEKYLVFKCINDNKYLKPNIQNIKRITGFHTNTIKSSINYLNNEDILEKYAPYVRFEKGEQKYFIFDFFKIDFSDEEKIKILQKAVTADEHLFHAGKSFEKGTHNFVMGQVYTTIDKYHQGFDKKYYTAEGGLFNFLKNRETIFISNMSIIKQEFWPTRSKTILEMLIHNSGKEIDLD